MNTIRFQGLDGTFEIDKPENYSGLYFPLAGDLGLKSSITPTLGGDSKRNQNAFLMKPVSVDDLHNNRSGRNFWCNIEGEAIWSAAGASAEAEWNRKTKDQEESKLTAGLLWQKVERTSKKYEVSSEITSFVPYDQNVEIMLVKITNNAKTARKITCVAAIPIYGRSADNIRDHRHVTSLLNRIETREHEVVVNPTMSFDERGHQKNKMHYFVGGSTGEGKAPKAFYPTVELFLGEGGTFTNPEGARNFEHAFESGTKIDGKEALGGICFEEQLFEVGETKTYIVWMGASERNRQIAEVRSLNHTEKLVEESLEKTKRHWQNNVNVHYHTGNAEFDNYMRWVSVQPILRRIYGCSFLPHHDYGKGGRGWRDLWQDCLALLLMDPSEVGEMIVSNFGGVRVDGSNATIIGEKQGEFVADRNNITRVWMDHGMWPWITTKLYLDQTGDLDILLEKTTYFKDPQIVRGTAKDQRWKDSYGNKQKTVYRETYFGTVIEHLLLQHLCAFYEVGEHNHMRLRGADWNDALDMANERGESVAFTAAYAGNLKDMAKYLRILKEKRNIEFIEVMEEMRILLRAGGSIYDDVEAKTRLLQDYCSLCQHNISGKTVHVQIDELADSLNEKADWMMEHIRKTEWISSEDKKGWFNSYYDNDGDAVEGFFEDQVRMMLTGQVFTIMSGTAKTEQIPEICKAADAYLYDEKAGGYRLNTNFEEVKFNLGRMFGFAYGEKENGAVFSHMEVMYANALYQRGFAREGYKALQTLADRALDFETSRIYPGIPEYFNADGRGLYHYLTGAASWYMLTVITQVFGVKGSVGDFVIEPKLCKEQFDKNGNARLAMPFMGKLFRITRIRCNCIE